jgi:tRNA 2-thiouridine synthesizing protein A
MPVKTLELATVVDARGLSCPMPIVRLAQSIKSLPAGAEVELLATDPGSVRDVDAWCRSTGNDLIEESSQGGVHRFLIRRK